MGRNRNLTGLQNPETNNIRRIPTFEEPKKSIEAIQMSIPDFQSVMLPLLKATSNGKQWQLTAIREELARLFRLSPDERRELLPSGTPKNVSIG